MCSMLAVYVNTLLNQGLFWQKPRSLQTSKSEAVHLGKCTGSICNREDCAKYTFLLIQGENELVPCSKVCTTGLPWLAALQGVWGVTSTAEFSFQVCASILVTGKPQLCSQSMQPLFSSITCCVFLSLSDSRRD